MVRRLKFLAGLVCCLAVMAPAAKAQFSVSVFSYTSIQSDGSILSECASVINDVNTRMDYQSAIANCGLFEDNMLLQAYSCTGNPNADCTLVSFNVFRGQ